MGHDEAGVTQCNQHKTDRTARPHELDPMEYGREPHVTGEFRVIAAHIGVDEHVRWRHHVETSAHQGASPAANAEQPTIANEPRQEQQCYRSKRDLGDSGRCSETVKQAREIICQGRVVEEIRAPKTVIDLGKPSRIQLARPKLVAEIAGPKRMKTNIPTVGREAVDEYRCERDRRCKQNKETGAEWLRGRG